MSIEWLVGLSVGALVLGWALSSFLSRRSDRKRQEYLKELEKQHRRHDSHSYTAESLGRVTIRPNKPPTQGKAAITSPVDDFGVVGYYQSVVDYAPSPSYHVDSGFGGGGSDGGGSSASWSDSGSSGSDCGGSAGCD